MHKIQSWGRPSILQEDCIQKKISVWGINISLRVIYWREMKGSYSAVFKAVKGEILCLKFNLTGRLHPEKNISLGHKHLASGNILAGNEGFLFGRF
jgi:hypothetical protein